MNVAGRIEELKAQGFSEERAEVIVLMREAAILLFRAFPDAFVLYGGANLIFFQQSARHSADLDLLSTTGQLPEAEDLRQVLYEGLGPLSGLLDLEANVQILNAEESLKKLSVRSGNRALFTVDVTRTGALLPNEVERHDFESAASAVTATIRPASRNLLLFQKAEAFLLRRIVKVRDAYDIRLLLNAGAKLEGQLRALLETELQWREVDEEQIRKRIALVDAKRCRAELRYVLPDPIFGELEREDFQSLRDALLALYESYF